MMKLHTFNRRLFCTCCILAMLFLAACTTQAQGIPSATTSSVAKTEPTIAQPTTIATTSKQANGPMPPSRSSAQMAYDDKTNSLLFFGGNGVASLNGDSSNDTWTWNGSTWTQLHPANAPAPRNHAAIAYDAATGEVVLFGGSASLANGDGLLNDTWTWNGSDWTQMHPTVLPPARSTASMIYDSATQQMVLFGGRGTGTATDLPVPVLNDTWTWDGSNWTQQQPATVPLARLSATIAYDAATQNVLLFGGEATGPSPYPQDTWSWNGSNWIQLHPQTSPLLSLMNKGKMFTFNVSDSMVYNPISKNILLICTGGDDTNTYQMVWIWNGSNWTQKGLFGPNDAYLYGTLFYDPTLAFIIEFGSFLPLIPPTDTHSDVSVDTFLKWNGHTWENLVSWSGK